MRRESSGFLTADDSRFTIMIKDVLDGHKQVMVIHLPMID